MHFGAWLASTQSARRLAVAIQELKMSKVAINKPTSEQAEASLVERLETVADLVRRRAFEIFERRKGSGSDTEDWFEAERELTAATSCELAEKDGSFEVSLTVPGFKAHDVEVTALPDALVVSAQSSHEHEHEKKHVYYSEFSGRSLFRRVPLPEQIDTNKVTADLNDGILRIMAKKAVSASKTARAAA
jgi:HSP20 family protein